MALPHDIAIELDRIAERIMALANDPHERIAAIKRFEAVCEENSLDPEVEARKRGVTL
jgi:hypothetical protein